MRATPVLSATIKRRVRQETPRNPAKTGAHQGDGAGLVVEVVMAADSTRGGGPILAERRSVPGGDEAAVSGAGRGYSGPSFQTLCAKRTRRSTAAAHSFISATSAIRT